MKTDLKKIPYVGEKTKQALINIGIRCVEDLKGKDAFELYTKDCEVKGFKEDRCELYLLRMAIYYAENPQNNKNLKWWDFKDK